MPDRFADDGGDRRQLFLLVSASPWIINAVVPYDIPVNTRLQILVERGTALSVPIAIDTAAAQPAVFPAPDYGPSQGLIYARRSDGNASFAHTGSPARAGDQIIIYCAGLEALPPERPATFPDPVPQAAAPAVVA